MGVRYVVCAVSPDGDPHVFGTFTSKDKAKAFADRVNELVGRDEDAEQAQYEKEYAASRAAEEQGRYLPMDEMAPMPRGRAYARLVRRPLIREARLYSSEGAMPS